MHGKTHTSDTLSRFSLALASSSPSQHWPLRRLTRRTSHDSTSSTISAAKDEALITCSHRPALGAESNKFECGRLTSPLGASLRRPHADHCSKVGRSRDLPSTSSPSHNIDHTHDCDCEHALALVADTPPSHARRVLLACAAHTARKQRRPDDFRHSLLPAVPQYYARFRRLNTR